MGRDRRNAADLGPAGFDTDRDGMPDYWEVLRGTNPAVADNNGVLSGDGYTNVENYINSLTFIANWTADADGNWSDGRSTGVAGSRI